MEDLLIIGAGPGGYETAVEAAKRGMKVTIINYGALGGVCLNEGCIPTKTFCHFAGEEDFAAVAARKEAVVNQLRNGVAYLLKNPNITVVEGKAVSRMQKRLLQTARNIKHRILLLPQVPNPQYCQYPVLIYLLYLIPLTY